MSTTELSVAWFAQSACSHSATGEFQSQLNENEFDSSTMLIDLASIGQQSLKRFEKLRAVKANDQVIFPANHFRPADSFGEQFLSHAVYEYLLNEHIAYLRLRSTKTFEIGVFGEVQNEFYIESWPEYFFYFAAEWDKRKLQDKIWAFRINRPKIKVSEYVSRQKSKISARISSGNRTKPKERDYLFQTGNSTNDSPSLSRDEIESWLQRLIELLPEFADAKLARDFLDFRNALGVVLNCDGVAVTPVSYQQFMNTWNAAPQPIQGATSIQGILWKWLYVSFPDDRSKFFDNQGDSNADKGKKAMARSRRLKGLNEFLKNAVMRASL